jgi:hypothetical protein
MGIGCISIYILYILAGAGVQKITTRVLPTWELRGRMESDIVVHHHFNESSLNDIPWFGRNWWKFEFDEPGLGGCHLEFKV